MGTELASMEQGYDGGSRDWGKGGRRRSRSGEEKGNLKLQGGKHGAEVAREQAQAGSNLLELPILPASTSCPPAVVGKGMN